MLNNNWNIRAQAAVRTLKPPTATQTPGSGAGVATSAALDVARLTLLQDEADELRVSFLGGYMQRRATSGVPHQQADTSTDAFRQLRTGHT